MVPSGSLQNPARTPKLSATNLVLAPPRTDAISFRLTDPPHQAIASLGAAHVDAAHLNADINDHLAAHVAMAAHLETTVLPKSQQSGVNPDDIRSEKQASDFLRDVHSKLLAQAQQPPPPPGAAGRGAGN